MRPAILSLFVLVGMLSVAVAVLWFERDHGSGATPSESQLPGLVIEHRTNGSAPNLERSAASSDVDRRLGEMSKKLDDLIAEVEQFKNSAGRAPIAAPPPTEAEFVDRHRASVMQIVNDAQRQVDWNKCVESAQAIAGGMAGRCALPDVAKPALLEFAAEYMRRAGVLFDKSRSGSQDVNREGTPERAQWNRDYQDLNAWGEGRLAEIDRAHGKEMWTEFFQVESSLPYYFMPH